MIGGFTNYKTDVTQDHQNLATQVLAQVNNKLGQTYTKIRVLEYQSQVVAGTNFRFKCIADDSDFVNIKIYVPLPHTNQPPEVSEAELVQEEQPQQLMGGFNQFSNEVTEDHQNLANSVLDQINNQLGTSYQKIRVVGWQSQIVAGTNYKFKCIADDIEPVFVKIFVPLPHTNQPAEVSEAKIEQQLMGGFNQENTDVPAELQATVQSLLGQINGFAQQNYKSIQVVSFRTQVVAGTNYICTCQADGVKISVKVFKPLPHTNQPAQVVEVKNLN